jgi:hypothetical protein
MTQTQSNKPLKLGVFSANTNAHTSRDTLIATGRRASSTERSSSPAPAENWLSTSIPVWSSTCSPDRTTAAPRSPANP